MTDAARESTTREVTSYGALFLVAWARRFWAVTQYASEPVWDGHYYDFGARRIAAGLGYSDDLVASGVHVWHPWCHYPVGYSGFLAMAYRLFGDSPQVAHMTNVVVGSLLPLVTYALAREALPRWRALAAGAIVALHPGLVLYSALVMSEPLASLLVLASFWAAIRTARARRPWLAMLASGLLLGLGVLVRPQALLCAPFLALAFPVAPGKGLLVQLRGRLLPAAFACAATLAPVLPWTARNCRVMDACALVSTNAGWNLAIGAFPRATGRFETLRSSDGCREVTGQVQQDRCWMAYGLAYVRQDPVRWLGLVPAKLSYTFDHESFAVEYLHEARPEAWPEDRRSAERERLTGFHRVLCVLAPLAFVGLYVPGRGRERREAVPGRILQTALLGAVGLAAFASLSAATPSVWPMVLLACLLAVVPLPGRPSIPAALGLGVVLLASVAAAHAIFFGEDRYHMVTSPVLALLVAAALRPPAPRSTDEGAHDG
jgi:4-amino-4-deoxy-L-arabinose transferase-like glycosyltransferase